MRLERSVVLAAAMMAVAVAATACKSSDSGGQPGNTADPQPAVQAPADTSAPSNSDDPAARRARRHGGRGRGDWHRTRRASAPGSEKPGESPEVPPQQ